MLPLLLILAAWAIACVVVLAALYCAARADARTDAQLATVEPPSPQQAVDLEGYGSLLLKRLMVQTSRVIGVDAAAVFRYDPARDELVLIAGHRIRDDLIGTRVAARGHVRDVAVSGARVWASGTDLWPIAALLPKGPGALIAGIEGRGAYGLLVGAGKGPFSERDLALVGHVADLAGAGLGDAALRGELEAALEGGVRALEAAIERADLRAARTGRDITRMATTIGRMLGLDTPALVELQLAARLREVGELAPEIALEEAFLDAPPAQPHEIATRSADVLARVPGLEVVALIVRHEHERWDGRGSPGRLGGERIPLASRILAATAMYAELTGPGRASDFDAIAVIAVAAGTRFDPIVVETLAALTLPPAADQVPVERPEWAAADLELVAP
jgi:HD-GYP domain-containing protein (c-di-GMP phosphodiesterase class II)